MFFFLRQNQYSYICLFSYLKFIYLRVAKTTINRVENLGNRKMNSLDGEKKKGVSNREFRGDQKTPGAPKGPQGRNID